MSDVIERLKQDFAGGGPDSVAAAMDEIEHLTSRIKFLADRLAVALSDIVQRDMDYSDICFDDFYSSEEADTLRRSKQYQVCLDLIRSMVRNYDEKAARRGQGSEVRQEGGCEPEGNSAST